MKKLISIIMALSVICMQSAVFAEFEWAKDAVNYCVEKNILSGMENGDLALGDNITREQMAKIFVDAFSLTEKPDSILSFSDVDELRWSYKYINVFKDYMKKNVTEFNPAEPVTREEFASSLVLASGLKESNLRNPKILEDNFKDYEKVDEDYVKLLSVAVEKGYFLGNDLELRPNDLLTRAEACSLLYRVLRVKEDSSILLDLGVKKSQTPLMGEAQISLEAAKAWAESKGAHQRFIDIADSYWKYGEITGIRPEILYAQAAKETGYGKYGGAVIPEQNNWAGIKTGNPTGDATYDHESFETPDDGVRAHFNHISAYIGQEPVGEPHERYYNVKSISWAGTIKYLEELGGRWCPDLYYGYSILHNYIELMETFD